MVFKTFWNQFYVGMYSEKVGNKLLKGRHAKVVWDENWEYNQEKRKTIEEPLTIVIWLKCRDGHHDDHMITFYIHWGASNFACIWVSNSFCSPYEAELPLLLPVSWDLQNPLKKNPSSSYRVGSWGFLLLWMPFYHLLLPPFRADLQKGTWHSGGVKGPFSAKYQSCISVFCNDLIPSLCQPSKLASGKPYPSL